MSSLAAQPAQAPPPFADPILLHARRVQGSVLSDGKGGLAALDSSDDDNNNNLEAAASHPPKFHYQASTAVLGNILLIDEPPVADGSRGGASSSSSGGGDSSKKEPLAILLQRKVKESEDGFCSRVGYVLTRPSANHPQADENVWNVKKSPECSIYPYEMVEVSMEEKSKVVDGASATSHHHNNSNRDPKAELSALQLIASLENPHGLGGCHVKGSNLIAADQMYIYTISPYNGEGTLFDYCASYGRLSETDARFFFRQILKGLETLQTAQLCHRSLSLDAVQLRGTTCTIADLSCALRIPTADAADGGGSSNDSNDPTFYMIQPQPPCCGGHPHYLAPELLDPDAPFDGFAVDLWSCGVMLLALLLGSEALFATPLPGDRIFKEICIDGNLKGYLDKFLANANNWTAKQQQQQTAAAGQSQSQQTDSSEKNGGEAATMEEESGGGEPETTTTTTNMIQLSDDVIDLMQRMLRNDARARLTLQEVKQHPWVIGTGGGRGLNDDEEGAKRTPALPIRSASMADIY